jgi:predicted alpha/beta-fold hydrolase
MRALFDCGFRVALFYFRGCSGEPNRLARSYHSGETGDLNTVARHLADRYPARARYAVGISLGGNVLLKWLGEHPGQSLLHKAIAVSVPFELNLAAARLERGLSRIYQAHLLRKLRQSTRRKATRVALPIDLGRLSQLASFRDFDDHVTAPLHGFAGVDDYYRQSGSRRFLEFIDTPTLILHALDDPFMTPDAVPTAEELGSGVVLELSHRGGHVGFIAGALPWKPRYWIDQRVCDFLRPDG